MVYKLGKPHRGGHCEAARYAAIMEVIDEDDVKNARANHRGVVLADAGVRVHWQPALLRDDCAGARRTFLVRTLSQPLQNVILYWSILYAESRHERED